MLTQGSILAALQVGPSQQTQTQLPPILDAQELLIAGGMLLALALAGGISVAVLYRANPGVGEALARTQPLYILTVLAVVVATTVLALERIMTGDVAASVLSGIVGYVLGSLKQTTSPPTSGSQ